MTVQTFQPSSQPKASDDHTRNCSSKKGTSQKQTANKPISEQDLVNQVLKQDLPKQDNIIVSSRDELPRIYVNGEMIEQTKIAEEMQYQPAESKEDALYAAAKALVIQKLLREQVLQDQSLGKSALEEDEEKAVSDLLEKLIPVETANEQSCERYYKQNKEKYITDPTISVRHILLAVPPDAGDERLETRKLAYEIIEKIKNSNNPSAEFIEQARQYSACPSKQEGGELGEIVRRQTVPEFESKLFTLQKGLAPSPIETRYGFHVVEILKREDGIQLQFEQVKPVIVNHFAQQSFHHGLVDYLYKLVENADIKGIEMNMNEENVYRG